MKIYSYHLDSSMRNGRGISILVLFQNLQNELFIKKSHLSRHNFVVMVMVMVMVKGTMGMVIEIELGMG